MRISDWSSYVCSSDLTATSWLDGQHRAFVAFGGVPRIAVPDNPKALVAKPNRYEPTLSKVHADFDRHYGTTILPARVRKPKEKGAVAGAVKVIELRILAGARARTFATLGVLNVWLAGAITAWKDR